jgi:hypothetical protein
MILAGKNHLVDIWTNVKDPGARIALSDNGWTNDDLGFEWLQHFDAWSRKGSLGAYRLLLLDGHRSHLTLKFLRYAVDHNIILLCLPAHSTHRLQPLDVGIFGPMGKAYDALVKRFNRYDGRGVTQREYVDWIQQARDKACTEKNILSSFAAVGLFPFNPDRVLEKLRTKKSYTQPNTPPEPPQARAASNEPIVAPFYQVKQGTSTIDIPIGSFAHAEALVDRIVMATPSRANHINALKSLIQYQRADNAVLTQKVQIFESTKANEKPRTKRRVPGSAKVYSKEEVEALETARAKQEEAKQLKQAEREAKKLAAANKKAEMDQRRQERANKKAERQKSKESGGKLDPQTHAPAANESIRVTRSKANTK